jgi:hypothetical protein
MRPLAAVVLAGLLLGGGAALAVHLLGSEAQEPPPVSTTEGPAAAPTFEPTAEPVPTSTATPEPLTLEIPVDGAYVGAFAPEFQGAEGVEEWLADHVDELAIVHAYVGWGSEQPHLSRAWLDAVAGAGAAPMVTWEPWEKAPGQFEDPDQPEYRLALIAEGAFDDYIDDWAEVAAAFGDTILVRFAHEMNGFWYPWSVTENDNTPADYVAAWRHVHDRVRRAGADNVQWVWAMNTLSGLPEEQQALDVESFYPGEDYVDWVSVIGFNYGTSRPWSVWRSADEVLRDTYELLTELGPPVMISEIGTVDQGGDDAAWVRDAMRVLGEEYEEVAAVVWFSGPRADDIDFRLRGDRLEALREALAETDHWLTRPLRTAGD